MAKAFVPRIDDVVGNGNGTFTLFMTVVYSGSDVRNGTDLSPVQVILDGSDSVINIKNKLSNAVTTEAVRLGYTLLQNDVIIPDFQKG